MPVQIKLLKRHSVANDATLTSMILTSEIEIPSMIELTV